MAEEYKEEGSELDKELASLRNEVAAFRNKQEPNHLQKVGEKKNIPAPRLNSIQGRRILKGHFGKVYALQWSQDNRHIVSASQDGKLMVWNGVTQNKAHAILLQCCWVMGCAYAPSGNLIASGGLDNACTIYKVDLSADIDFEKEEETIELSGHTGYVSCCRFLDDTKMITSSGDSTSILWDIENQKRILTFEGHTGDVLFLSLDVEKGIFVTGSCDTTTKLWDFRDKKGCVQTFGGHEFDVNGVDLFPGSIAVGTASDDKTSRIYDLRSYRQINNFTDPKIQSGATSARFSKSGRLLFAGNEDSKVYVWDTVSGNLVKSLDGHIHRVSCVDLSPDGSALCTGSWDSMVRIWA